MRASREYDNRSQLAFESSLESDTNEVLNEMVTRVANETEDDQYGQLNSFVEFQTPADHGYCQQDMAVDAQEEIVTNWSSLTYIPIYSTTYKSRIEVYLDAQGKRLDKVPVSDLYTVNEIPREYMHVSSDNFNLPPLTDYRKYIDNIICYY